MPTDQYLTEEQAVVFRRFVVEYLAVQLRIADPSVIKRYPERVATTPGEQSEV